MLALPARAAANGKLAHAHRIAALEHFGIGQPGVGHVRVDGVGAVGRRASRPRRRRSFRNSRTCASPKSRLFIVPWLAAATPQCAQQHVDDALRGFDVAADHRRALLRASALRAD